MATVQETVLEYVRSEVTADRRIAYDISIHSLGGTCLEVVAIKTRLEKHYGIHIPDDVATREAFESVAGISRLLARMGVR